MENMEIKTFDFTDFKALSEEGEFEGYASTFGNVDAGGDRVIIGAFAKTLKKNGGRVPILDSHAMRVQLGWGIGAEEDKKGLKVHGQLNLEVEAARDKYTLAKQAKEIGARMGLSIGYSAKTSRDGDVRVLEEIKLYEYSLPPFPMNTRANITHVKDGRLVLAPTDLLDNVRTFETFLHDAVGFSKQEAVHIASKAFSLRSDSGDSPDVGRSDSGEEKALLDAVKKVTAMMAS